VRDRLFEPLLERPGEDGGGTGSGGKKRGKRGGFLYGTIMHSILVWGKSKRRDREDSSY